MQDTKFLKISGCGTCLTAICCFTPVLVILLGTVGLSSWLGWLDDVLLPALGIFIVLTAIAATRVVRQKREQKDVS